MEEVVYLNGSLVPRSRARISVFDHSGRPGEITRRLMAAYKEMVVKETAPK